MDSAAACEGGRGDEAAPSGLLESWPGIRTSSPDDLRTFLFSSGDGGRLDVADRSDRFFAQVNFARLSEIALGFAQFSSAIELSLPPLGMVSQHFCLRGRGERLLSGAAIPLTETESSVAAPEAEIHARTSPAYRGLALLVAPRALARKVETLLGYRLDRNIEFAPRANLADPLSRHLQHSIRFLAEELEAGEARLPASALKEFEEYLILLFLRANRHSASDLLQASEKRSAAPWQVKLTEDYLEANWSGTVTMEHIAAAAGVSARSIFKAFKQSRGYSPMSFLKDLRLKKARNLLQKSERGATVAEIATRCGFLSLGHFARDYEKRFGERPSVTLRAAKARR